VNAYLSAILVYLTEPSKKLTRQTALTRGRADHFSTKNTSNSQNTSRCNMRSWPIKETLLILQPSTLTYMTSTFELDPRRVKLNRHVNQLPKSKIISATKLMVRTHRHTSDRLLYLDHSTAVKTASQGQCMCYYAMRVT